jgi:hypothetical protein
MTLISQSSKYVSVSIEDEHLITITRTRASSHNLPQSSLRSQVPVSSAEEAQCGGQGVVQQRPDAVAKVWCGRGSVTWQQRCGTAARVWYSGGGLKQWQRYGMVAKTQCHS